MKRTYLRNAMYRLGDGYDYDIVATTAGRGTAYYVPRERAEQRTMDYLPLSWGLALSGPDGSEFFLRRDGILHIMATGQIIKPEVV